LPLAFGFTVILGLRTYRLLDHIFQPHD
jgi:hypothetical protein